MSDIRSGNWQGQSFEENEKSEHPLGGDIVPWVASVVRDDMSAQLAWWKAMRPQKALMKFR